ncbi:tyrosine-type recombinase/integrase [Roseibium album]|uniref:tyrosine-type recombinase/integrase n=1 Tax=Roseibium album TaxID=311410 RepID=UPI0032999100
MPKLSDKALTETYLRNLKSPSSRSDIYDAVQRGLGLRLSPSGTKTWFVMRRVDGRMKRLTLGRYPEIGVAAARKQAADIFERISMGAQAKAAAAPRFHEVLDDWLERDQVARKRKSASEKRRALEHDVLPVLADKRIDTITKSDIREILDRVVKRGAPIHANRLLAYVRRMFNWAVEQDIISASPANGIKKLAEESSRDRTLSSQELAAVWNTASMLADPFGAFIKTLILTGQRRGEVAGAQWRELNFDKGEWVIPSERAKNGKAHLVHISDQLTKILHGSNRPNDSQYVFTTNGTAPISGFSKIKANLDKLAPIESWTLHDLRRTFATITTGDLGIDPAVVDKILNHSSGAVSGIAAVYQRHAYLDQRRTAMDKWDEFIVSLT